MGLDTHELLHAKIIRDANKIDKLEINLLPLETIYYKEKEEIEKQLISESSVPVIFES